jgi:hypothetical protein
MRRRMPLSDNHWLIFHFSKKKSDTNKTLKKTLANGPHSFIGTLPAKNSCQQGLGPAAGAPIGCGSEFQSHILPVN